MTTRIALPLLVPPLAAMACNKQAGTPAGLQPLQAEPIHIGALDSADGPSDMGCGYSGTGPVPDVTVATCLAGQGGLPIDEAVHVWTNEYPEGWRIYAILDARCDPPFASGQYVHVMRDDGRILMDVVYEYQEDNPPDLDCWTQQP
ncbi:MAG: hypothetical protein R3F61_30755 [Myxococcota bacterium]